MNTAEESHTAGCELVSAALVEAQGQVKAAEFDSTNPFFKSKYASLGAVIGASREALHKNGLAILQVPTVTGDLVSVHTRIIHKSGQMLDCGTMTLGLAENDRNSDAQLAGAIITYLRRYSWASVLGIYADADDDGNAAPKTANRAPQPRTSQPAKPTMATDKTRLWAIDRLKAGEGGVNRRALTDYATAQGWITVEQTIESWPLEHVPVNGEQILELIKRLDEFGHTPRGAQ